jgi:hypothetical protein
MPFWMAQLDMFKFRFNDLPPQLQSDRNFLLGALEADGLLLEPWPGEFVEQDRVDSVEVSALMVSTCSKCHTFWILW